MLLNSPGGSTLQCGVGRGLMRLAVGSFPGRQLAVPSASAVVVCLLETSSRKLQGSPPVLSHALLENILQFLTKTTATSQYRLDGAISYQMALNRSGQYTHGSVFATAAIYTIHRASARHQTCRFVSNFTGKRSQLSWCKFHNKRTLVLRSSRLMVLGLCHCMLDHSSDHRTEM